jgi:hypothetical protein
MRLLWERAVLAAGRYAKLEALLLDLAEEPEALPRPACYPLFSAKV